MITVTTVSVIHFRWLNLIRKKFNLKFNRLKAQLVLKEICHRPKRFASVITLRVHRCSCGLSAKQPLQARVLL